MDNASKLLQLVSGLGEIHGRKKLQKIVHILQATRNAFDYDFGYLHFGPYSTELTQQIDSLNGVLVNEEKSSTAGGYPTYILEANANLRTFLRDIGASDDPEWLPIAIELNKKSAPFLEAVSTILYLHDRGIDSAAIAEKFAALKPQLVSQFHSASTFATRLRDVGREPKR